jgi:hypothetical protein
MTPGGGDGCNNLVAIRVRGVLVSAAASESLNCQIHFKLLKILRWYFGIGGAGGTDHRCWIGACSRALR